MDAADRAERADRTDTVDRTSAVSRLRELGVTRRTETVSIGRGAIAGRTVATPVTAPDDVPANDFATMDGFALRSDDDYPLTIVGSVGPADDPGSIDAGEAVRVATGSPLPSEADAVLPREDATVTNGQLTGPALEAGTNRYPAGRTATEGEVLFEPGARLGARHAALLADVGVDRVTAFRPLSVGVVATGTEIHAGDQPDRDSEMLANLVRRWGHEPTVLGSVPDDPERVRAAVESAAADHDAVFTSGGTSVGDGDHVTGVLSDHELLFSGVAVRPGRPLTAATVDGTLAIAFPGKPLAAHAAATLVVRPAFVGGTPGASLPMVRVDPIHRVTLPDAPFEYAIPVTIDDGRATPLGHGDSEIAVYGEQFAPGRVASSTRLTCSDGVAVTTEPLVPGRSVDVVLHEVVE